MAAIATVVGIVSQSSRVTQCLRAGSLRSWHRASASATTAYLASEAAEVWSDWRTHLDLGGPRYPRRARQPPVVFRP
jgi:hypothetical protein